MEKPYYYNMPIDVIEFCQANNLPFDVGNIIKYVVRYKNKNGVKDLIKAREYIDRMIFFELSQSKKNTRSIKIEDEITRKKN